jgi:hypothetical protein
VDDDVMITSGFSIGGLHGWRGIALGLAGSVVFLIAGRQDLGPGLGIVIPKPQNPPRWPSSEQVFGPRLGVVSSTFWFFLALISEGGVIWLGVGARIWGGALLGAAVFYAEVWLIRRWWRQVRSP